MNRPAAIVFDALVAISGLYAIWSGIRFVGTRISCQTEELPKIQDASGLTFEREDTTCTTLGTDEEIRVYARETIPKGTWAFLDWRYPRTLLFGYDPGNSDNPLPSITRLPRSTILISIPEVSSIACQNRKWKNISINYAVRHVDHPAPSK